jgi:hypothetical protein
MKISPKQSNIDQRLTRPSHPSSKSRLQTTTITQEKNAHQQQYTQQVPLPEHCKTVQKHPSHPSFAPCDAAIHAKSKAGSISFVSPNIPSNHHSSHSELTESEFRRRSRTCSGAHCAVNNAAYDGKHISVRRRTIRTRHVTSPEFLLI